MKTIKLEVYSAKELKEKQPKAFEKAYERFKQDQYTSGLAWGDEMLKSLKAVIELGGYRLKDYSLGDSSCRGNFIKLEERDCDDLSGKRAFAWLENNVLSKLRDKKGQLDAGKLTGYCLDYDLVESLQKGIKEGSSVREAFMGLADTYVEQVDAEWEDQTSEERFMDDSEANEWEYFADGRQV